MKPSCAHENEKSKKNEDLTLNNPNLRQKMALFFEKKRALDIEKSIFGTKFLCKMEEDIISVILSKYEANSCTQEHEIEKNDFS